MRVIVLYLGALLSLASAVAFAQGSTNDVDKNKPSVAVGPGTPKEKKDHPATVRKVSGLVIDQTGQPVDGALVSLTDLKSKEKWTFVTKANGKYNFDTLSLTVDYELNARKGAVASIVKHLSQYDRSTPLVRNLEIDLGALPKTAAATGTSAAPAKQ
jgi:hypothetical protein